MKIVKIQKKFADLIPKNIDICLLGLQGSRGHGLPHKFDADYDYRGIFIRPNSELLGMEKHKETIEINVGAGDEEAEFVFHEVGKFFSLAMKGNPSILSLLFLPKYNISNNFGNEIVKNKNIFLGAESIRKAFGGYAMSQILYLKRNHKFPSRQKIEKHLRHCFRLFDEGQELLETGGMTLPVKDPDKYEKISKITDIEKIFEMFEKRDKEFQSCKTILPTEPNKYLANKLLLKIRGF